MWVFVIPLVILLGATSTGIAVELSRNPQPPQPPGATSTGGARTPR